MSKWWIYVILVLQLAISAISLQIHELEGEKKDYKVKIKMYYSSMCPFSKRYLRRNLGNAIKVPVTNI